MVFCVFFYNCDIYFGCWGDVLVCLLIFSGGVGWWVRDGSLRDCGLWDGGIAEIIMSGEGECYSN